MISFIRRESTLVLVQSSRDVAPVMALFLHLLLTLFITVDIGLCETCTCNQNQDNVACTANIRNPYPGHTVMKALVDGRCIYALDHTVVYDDARSFCEDNGLRLVQFQQTCQQKAVFEVTDWMQHWVGLEKTGEGTWQWVDGNSMVEADIPSTRWEHAPDADLSTHTRAYTMTTYNQEKYHLKPVEVTASYRPVCEDYSCAGGNDQPRLHIMVAMVTLLSAVNFSFKRYS